MNEDDEELLRLICDSGGGLTMRELMKATGRTFTSISEGIRNLQRAGYKLSGVSVGGVLHRVLLSPYDKRHDELINNN